MINKITLFTVAVVITGCSTFSNRTSTPPPSIFDFGNDITKEKLYDDLAVLSHDSLKGRDTGTEGLDKAAHFLANHYEKAGLLPVGDESTYFQHFDLVQNTINAIEYTVTAAGSDFTVETTTHSNEEIGSFVTLFGGSDSLKGEIIFAGKGMFDEAQGINHFPENIDGKWLLVLMDRANTNMGYIQSRLGSGGALGVIMLSGTNVAQFVQLAEARQQRFGQGGRMELAYRQNNDEGTAPALNSVNPETAAILLGLENADAIAEVGEKISADPAGFKAKKLGFILEHYPSAESDTITTKNVVAFLEGSNPELKDEVVVLSAHYDHDGVGQPDSTGDAIYNGADDDGSGTVATLHTALAMAKAKEAGAGPERSVLFLHVSAEEKGLLGSRYYSDHPIFPIDNTIANINIDMIGRVDEAHKADSNYVYVIGGEIISSGIDSLTQIANNMGPNLTLSKRYNDLDDPNQFYRRSDHWNFGRLGVPFVFFFNGTHPDYHRPSDEIDKITFGPLTKRTHLVYNLTALLANTDERPVVDNQEFIEKTQVQPR